MLPAFIYSDLKARRKNDFTLVNGLRSNVYYSQLSDFAKMKQETDICKIMVIGEMGMGKSSLCSKMTGVKLKFNDNDEESEFGDLTESTIEKSSKTISKS